MYLEWDEFVQSAKQLYYEYPQTTRYSITFRKKDNKLAVKVTNDHVVFQYKTDNLADRDRISRLNSLFFALNCAKDVIPDRIEEMVVQEEKERLRQRKEKQQKQQQSKSSKKRRAKK